MTNRERILAVLDYQPYDRMPVVQFGFLRETLDKWREEGHLNVDQPESAQAGDVLVSQDDVARHLGFDCSYDRIYSPIHGIWPAFEPKVLEQLPDGARRVLNGNGVVLLERPGAKGIPMEFDHLLKGRAEWDEHFRPRLQFFPERVTDGGSNLMQSPENRGDHCLLFCGSLYGSLRNYAGMEGLCYIGADDEDLLIEMIDVTAELSYKCVEGALKSGIRCDGAHFWEDICFKNGPLVNPKFFAQRVGPHYKRITDLLKSYGIDLVSLDCDGMIDSLLPIWLENGVNVMFPIEVGTWNASIEPWREKYGEQVRGVGGMRKYVFALDYAAVDAEIERLRRLIELGGYIPCPDHRISEDAKWENVQYYCERMHEIR